MAVVDRSRWARVLRLRPREVVTSLHAACVLVAVELAVRCLPLPRLCERFGVRLDLGPAGAAQDPIALAELPGDVRRKLRCARGVTEIWPFSKGPCLRRSLVAGHLIRRLRPAVRIGVIGTGDALTAHAWLELGGRPLEQVQGYGVFEQPCGRAMA